MIHINNVLKTIILISIVSVIIYPSYTASIELGNMIEWTEGLSDIALEEDHKKYGRYIGSSGEQAAKEYIVEKMNLIGLEIVDDEILLNNLRRHNRKEWKLTVTIDGEDPIEVSEIEMFPFPSDNPLTPNHNIISNAKVYYLRNDPKTIGGNRVDLIVMNESWKDEFLKLSENISESIQNGAKGFLLADWQDDTYFMYPSCWPRHPRGSGISIKGSLGQLINNSINSGKDVYVDYCIETEMFDSDFKSYNIEGKIDVAGTDKKIVLGAHYDGWFNQATIDNAAGVGMLLGVAEDIVNSVVLNLKYDIEFVTFGAHEESVNPPLGGSSCSGSKWYRNKHLNPFYSDYKYNDIQHVIIIDEVAQIEPGSWLRFDSSNDDLNDILEGIITSNYGTYSYNRSNNEAGIDGQWYGKKSIVLSRDPYKLYHRSGSNHQKGDIKDNLDDEDEGYLETTANIIRDLVIRLASNPPGELFVSIDAENEGVIGENISLDGVITGGKGPYNYTWNFSDGNSTYTQNTSHIFSNISHYYVTLNVTDSNNPPLTNSDDIVINILSDLEAIPNGPYVAEQNQTVQLQGNTTGGTPSYTYYWTIKNQENTTLQTLNGQNVEYTFTDKGLHYVTLEVIDSADNHHVNTTTANIKGVLLSANPDPTVVDETMEYTATLYGYDGSSYYYEFDFGNGNTDSETDTDSDSIVTVCLNNGYSSTGTYTVEISVYTNQTKQTSIDNHTIDLQVLPYWVLSGGPYAGQVNNSVSFTGEILGNYDWINAEWDYGDGNTGNGLSTSHTYTESFQEDYKYYNVSFKVSSPGENPVYSNTTAKIWNDALSPPVADAGGPYEVHPDTNISIDGSSSYHPDAGDGSVISEYLWNFTGDYFWESTGSTSSVTKQFSPYSIPQTYQVKLKTVDDKNFSDTDTAIILVTEVQSDFYWSPKEPTDLQTIQFTDDSDHEPYEVVDYWKWEFGDGSVSYSQNPTHQYSDDGCYYVKLTVRSDGIYDSSTQCVRVHNVPPTVDFNVSSLVAAVNDTILVKSTSDDPDGEMIGWKYYMGDGVIVQGENGSHEYNESGWYPLSLRVTDDDGDSSILTNPSELLIADVLVSDSFNENSHGWNTTRFSSIQQAIDAAPIDGIMVVLDDTYTGDIVINKSLRCYAVKNGYVATPNWNDPPETILFGDVIIEGEQTVVDITAENVYLEGFCVSDGNKGFSLDNYSILYECSIMDSSIGIFVDNHSENSMINCSFLKCPTGLYLNSSDDNSMINSSISGSDTACYLNASWGNLFSGMSINSSDNGLMLCNHSNYTRVEESSFITLNETGILIDDSTMNLVSDCSISHADIGISIGNVSKTMLDKEKSTSFYTTVLNRIENTNLSYNTIGVSLYNASHTRIGDEEWRFKNRDGLVPSYESEAYVSEPISPFSPDSPPGNSLFVSNDYPIKLYASDFNVIDGISVKCMFSDVLGLGISSQVGINLIDSCNNTIHYCLIEHANQTGILLNQSDNNTIALSMIKENEKGVFIEELSENNLCLGNSFYKNTRTGVNLSLNTVSNNFVYYNDFMFNGEDDDNPLYITMDSYIQAWDNGDTNSWDDNQSSLWREWISDATEIEDNSSIGVGNFWSDYNGTNTTGFSLSYTPYVFGPVPCDFTDFPPDREDYPLGLPLPPVGNTSYVIPGSAGSEDRYPLLRPIWPAGWYDQIEHEDIASSPVDGGLGGSVKISANVSDLFHNVTVVRVNISGPDGNWTNVTMNNMGNDTYQFNFTGTWDTGLYTYSIWASNDNNYTNSSNTSKFWVNASASMNVCTLYNSYTSNVSLNLTDPPGGVHNDIGYELLEDGSVLHVWNRFDSYYFDVDSGIQLTNHLDEYWTRNILMLGYYSNDEWNVLYRTDELSGFNKQIDTDDSSYLNATLWKDLTYGNYDFRLAIRYHLGVDDHELTVIPYIKNLGISIPYDLGFAWEVNDIQIDMTPEDDYLLINDTSYWLNETLDLSFTNLTRPISCWNESLNQSEVCGFEPIPYFYIREDQVNGASKSLYLKWNPDVNYKVWIKSRNDTYNAPVVLGMKIGTLDCNQSKQTKLYWYDASEVTYYFDAYSVLEAWASYPAYMVNNNTGNAASTSSDGDSELCNSNSCPSGTDLGTISKVEIRGAGVKSGTHSCSIIFRPSFSGKSGDDHTFTLSTTSSWSDWFDITEDTNAPKDGWTWNDVIGLDCRAISDIPIAFPMPTAYCAKIEVRVTYTSYTPPCISNPSPSNGVTNVSISPTVGIMVSDDDGDTLSISWLSNSSGSWSSFGSNNSVGNGTYYQTLSGANVNGQWWYWMVNVSDGNNYNESSVFKFYTGTQSKISNTGSTNLSGYLLMQVEYLSDSTWTVDSVVINDSSLRTINASSELGLDTVFNDLISVGELVNGDGGYRVYAALRDSDGEVLEVDGEKLEAWWRFEVDLI